MSRKLPIFMLLFFILSSNASRPHPGFSASSPTVALSDSEALSADQKAWLEDNCEGVEEEECLILMRRTLAAHLDYIYTQKQKN